jgi:hypothetical protein
MVMAGKALPGSFLLGSPRLRVENGLHRSGKACSPRRSVTCGKPSHVSSPNFFLAATFKLSRRRKWFAIAALQGKYFSAIAPDKYSCLHKLSAC